MFSRWQCYSVVHSSSKSKRQSTSPSTWMATSNHRWRLGLLQATWCWITVFHSCEFKSNIWKNDVHELGDSRHTLSMYCGRYIGITSEKTQVYLSKKYWSQLMDLASACIDRQVINFCRIQDDLVEWRDKCVESKCWCTPPNTNAINFDALWDELSYKNMSSTT